MKIHPLHPFVSFRKTENISQTKLAEMCGCAQTRISAIERGLAWLSIYNLEKLYDYYRINNLRIEKFDKLAHDLLSPQIVISNR